MARDEQIRVDLVAKDDASKVIGKVADAAEDLEKLSPEVDITADDDASKVLDEVDDAARDLDKLSPEVDVTADAGKARAEIDQLGNDIRELQRADAELVLRAKVDQARGELKALQGELAQTGERAEDTARQLDRVDGDGGGGLSTRGNAIADLTGPLGEASGAASDFAGVFDGLGDIVSDAAGKMGASASQAAAISGAVGGLGIAVAGAAAVWSLYTANQKKAREEQDRLIAGQRKLNDALAEGNNTQAAEELIELYKDQYEAARKAGIGAGELTDYLTGVSDTLPSLNAQLRNLNEEQARSGDASSDINQRLDEQRLALVELLSSLNAARSGYVDTNGTIAEQQARLEAVTAALGDTTQATDDATLAQMAGTAARRDDTGAAKLNSGAVDHNTDIVDTNTSSLGRNKSALDSVRQGLDNLRNGLNMERTILSFRDTLDEALSKVQSGASLSADEVLTIKENILDVAESAGATPIEVETSIDALENGDLNAVKLYGEQWFARNPVNVKTVIRPPSQGVGSAGGGGIPLTAMASAPASAPVSVVNVTQYLPRGYRERDVLAAAQRAARRAGGTYRSARS